MKFLKGFAILAFTLLIIPLSSQAQNTATASGDEAINATVGPLIEIGGLDGISVNAADTQFNDPFYVNCNTSTFKFNATFSNLDNGMFDGVNYLQYHFYINNFEFANNDNWNGQTCGTMGQTVDNFTATVVVDAVDWNNAKQGTYTDNAHLTVTTE